MRMDGSVVLRATISVPELRPKSVPVQFIVAIDVAKALAEQLPIAVRTAELQKQQGGYSRRAEHEREAISEGTKAAPAAAKARRKRWVHSSPWLAAVRRPVATRTQVRS
jgi:hypothetical protein